MQTKIIDTVLDKSKNPFQIHYGDKEIEKDIELLSSIGTEESGETLVALFSERFTKNQVKISIKENKLIVLIYEHVHKTDYRVNLKADWEEQLLRPYTKIHNVSILLPSDNFHIIRHFLIPEQMLLKIKLGKMAQNRLT